MVVVNTSSIIPTEKKKSVIQSIARTALIPSVVIGNAITGVIEKNIQKKVDSSYTAGRTTTKEASETTFGKVLGTAIAGTAAALVVASGTAGKVLSTTKGKAAGLVVAGAASISPTVTKAVIEAPAALVDTGIGIGKAVENLPTETTKDLGVGGLLVAGAGGLLAGAAGSSIINYFKDNKAALPETISTGNQGGMLGTSDIISNSGVVTPQTASNTTTKRKKKRSKPQHQNITQSVRISINNQNKRYLNVLRH